MWGPESPLDTLILAAFINDVSEEKQRQRKCRGPRESVLATHTLRDGESSVSSCESFEARETNLSGMFTSVTAVLTGRAVALLRLLFEVGVCL